MNVSSFIRNMIPITQFNKGKASPLFAKAGKGETLIVIKNNAPIAVVISVDQYESLDCLRKMCKNIADGNKIDRDEIKKCLEKMKEQNKYGE